MTLQRSQVLRVENLRDQADILVHAHGLPIRDGDAGGFLPAVLQGKQAKKGHARHIFIRGINAKHAALFVRMVICQSQYRSAIKVQCLVARSA